MGAMLTRFLMARLAYPPRRNRGAARPVVAGRLGYCQYTWHRVVRRVRARTDIRPPGRAAQPGEVWIVVVPSLERIGLGLLWAVLIGAAGGGNRPVCRTA